MSSSVAVRIDFRVRSVGVYNVYRQEALLVNQHLELQKHSFIFFFLVSFPRCPYAVILCMLHSQKKRLEDFKMCERDIKLYPDISGETDD